MVMTTNVGIKVIVEACVHWTSVPWSASMLRNTIDSTAMKSSITNANLFLDLASEVIDDRRVGADVRRQKRKSRQKIRPPTEDTSASPVSTPSQLPAPPSAQPQSTSLGDLMVNPFVRYALACGAVVLFSLIVFVFVLGSRVSSLESQLAKVHLDENVVSRVAFLEYFVSQLHKNLTGAVLFYRVPLEIP